MNDKLFGFVMLVVGLTIGSAASYQYTKKKYEQIAQEEIDSVKKSFSKKEDEPVTKIAEVDNTNNSRQAKEKPSVAEYAARLQDEGYTNYSNVTNEKESLKEVATPMEKPYIIVPEAFGELDDDVDDTVGLDSLNHFGEYEEDSIFVRNDRLKCDYEILMDQRKYSDVVNTKPHQVED